VISKLSTYRTINNYRYLHQLSKEDMVTGLPQIKFSNGIYRGCILGKNPEQKFDKGQAWRASSPLQLIHSDVMGPFPEPSINKYRYVLTFIDNYSRFTLVYFLTLKSQVFQYFKEFKALVENQSEGRIKILHSDNGGEYVNKDMQLPKRTLRSNIQCLTHRNRTVLPRKESDTERDGKFHATVEIIGSEAMG
jgi:transposase InsO family protein